jgi:hypothetical protein
MKNTNQHDINDPHKVTKLVEEWDQTAKTVKECQAETIPRTCLVWDRICPVHPKTFFLTLILELQGSKLDETWTQGSPQYKEQVLKEVFPKYKDFPFNFG